LYEEPESYMVAMAKENKITSDNAPPVRDDPQGVAILLDTLASCRLGERIAEAARLAMAEHLRQSAQKMRSAVEAENSIE